MDHYISGNVRCTWRCNATAGPGWFAINYDDSDWPVPYYVDGYYYSSDSPNMDTRSARIWEETFTVDTTYCRGRRLMKCDIANDPMGSYFIKTDPTTICMGMRLIASHLAKTKIECGAICTGAATSCHHSTEVTCLPQDDGCCGYLYDIMSGMCDIYTRDVPRGDGQSQINPPAHQYWDFYVPL